MSTSVLVLLTNFSLQNLSFQMVVAQFFFARSHSLPPSFECMCNVYACFWCSVFRFWFIVWAESNKQCLRKLVCVSVSVYVSSYFLFLFIRFVRLFKYGCGLWGCVFYAVGNNAYSNGSEKMLKTFAITDSFILSQTHMLWLQRQWKGREVSAWIRIFICLRVRIWNWKKAHVCAHCTLLGKADMQSPKRLLIQK